MPTTPNTEIGTNYTNIIDEVKQRLEIIERVLARQPSDHLDHIATSDLCALQFRKVCEGIALGCLLVHGDLPRTAKLKKDKYRADIIVKALEDLHPDFYPVPCRTVRDPAGKLRVMRYASGEYLSKARLKKLYTMLDHELHVGTLSRRTYEAQPIGSASFTTLLGWTRALLFDHFINLVDPDLRMVVQMKAPGITVTVHSMHPIPTAV